MDPISQATLGAAAAALLARSDTMRRALLVGAVAGAVPDLDVLIKSADDPLLQLEFHRHFSHSLLLAPVIGVLVAVLMRWAAYMRGWKLREVIPFGIAGALTHGVLDSCTSYGTLLYWPFSRHRESWDIISIIDPLLTLPLLALLGAAFIRRRPALAWCAGVFCLAYLSFGILQRERAESFARELASSRGHDPQALAVRPSFANLLLWRICYRAGDDYHVDAVRTFPGTAPRLYPGSSVRVFGPGDAGKLVPEHSTAARDIARFRFFSQGYLYRDPERPEIIGDLRYSMFPDSVTPLWGITVNPGRPEAHAKLVYLRDPSKRSFQRLWSMIQGEEVEANW
jgi:inner membrane protein